jgi:hypothetical protein
MKIPPGGSGCKNFVKDSTNVLFLCAYATFGQKDQLDRLFPVSVRFVSTGFQSQPPPAKRVAWMFGLRPARQQHGCAAMLNLQQKPVPARIQKAAAHRCDKRRAAALDTVERETNA